MSSNRSASMLSLMLFSLAACKAEKTMTSNEEPKPAIFDLDAAVSRANDPAAAGQPSGLKMRLKALKDLPPDTPELLRRWHMSAHRGRPPIAVVDTPLPDGAVAKVVRDPASETPRLIVVSRQNVDDEALLLGQFLLTQSEINHLEVGEKRTITVWRDRRYTVESGGKVESGTFEYTYLGSVGERSQTDILLRLAAAGAEMPLGESVRARVVPGSARSR